MCTAIKRKRGAVCSAPRRRARPVTAVTAHRFRPLRRVLAALLCAAVAAAAVSCSQALGPGGQSGGGGSLSLGVTAAAKSAENTQQLSPESYLFSGSGPRGASFSVFSGDGGRTVTGLVAGEWTVRGEGLNENDEVILEGEAAVEVQANGTTPLELALQPAEGAGGIRATAQWNTEHTVDPSANVKITGPDGETTAASLPIVSGGFAERELTELAAGSYHVAVKLYDGEVRVAGSVYTARVLKGSTAEISAEFNVLNKVGEPLEARGDSFTLGWDPPGNASAEHYRVYYRARNEYEWSFLGEAEAGAQPRFTVTQELLDYGTYEFAVRSVNAEGQSKLHTSMCDDAQPGSGWYVKWSLH